MNNHKDSIYTEAVDKVDSFKFDDRVAGVFSDMIKRSVPGYAQILSLLPTLARYFGNEKAHYYDLGCSLGAGMVAIAEGLKELKGHSSNAIFQIHGIDNSQAMIDRARPLIDQYTIGNSARTSAQHDAQHSAESNIQMDLQCADINNLTLQTSALVLMNFTLQFIQLDHRDQLIENIYKALCHGGALVLSEKIRLDDEATHQTLIELHHQFKSDQGYSQLEISQKRDAIENVLIPETLSVHTERLKQAGFRIVTPWLQNLQFVSILAIK